MKEIIATLDALLPYKEWRKGQRRLAEEAYRVSKEGGVLLVNYPTGIGKTVAVLIGTIKAATEDGLKIFYTAKTKNQLFSPLRELKKIKEKWGALPVSLIYNKRDMCLYKNLKTLDYIEFIRFCSLLVKNNKCPFYLKLTTINFEYLNYLIKKPIL